MTADLAPATAEPDARFTKSGVGRGVRQTIPLGLGAIAFGAAFGILARNSGLGDASALPNALLMSLVVYSGTAQIVGIELWSAGASNWAIWGATALVSIRYVLLGFTMRDWFRGLPRTVVYPSLFLTADQSWALTHAEMSSRTSSGKRDAGFFLGCNLTLAAGWIAGTALGVIAGGHIPDPSAWGLEFAATAAFIAILAGTYRGRSDIAPWIVAAGVALIAERIVPGQWFVLAGALSGSIAGAARSTTRHES